MEDRETVLLTFEEVAHILRIDERTVTKLLEENEIPGLRIEGEWRILPQDLMGFLCRKRQEQQFAALQRALEGPRALARALNNHPDLKRQIETTEFAEGTFGSFLKQGLAVIEAEAQAGNVIDISTRKKGDS